MKSSPMTCARVNSCLSLLGCGLLAVVAAACSQSQSQKHEAEGQGAAVSPVVQPVGGEAAAPALVEKKPQAVVKPAASPAVQPKPAPAYRPVAAVNPYVPSAPGKRIFSVNVPGPYVALTFDDGPSATCTPQVLDILLRHGASATFFVQGQNARRNPALLARAVAEGHEIGSHTWNHINMRSSSTSRIIDQLDRTSAAIEKATGSAPKVMRPPYGAVNAKLADMVYSRYGTPAILWDVDTNDWRKPGTETIVRRAVGNAKPGSIILLHDIHPTTVAAVEDIVTGLQARGFKLVTVSQLIALGRRAAGVDAPQPATPAGAEAIPAAGMPAAPAVQAPASPLPAGSATIGTTPDSPAASPAEAAPFPTPSTPALQPGEEEEGLDFSDYSL